MKPEFFKNHLALVLAVMLVLATAALYLPSVKFGFITIDDRLYTSQNALVAGGLSFQGIKEAFTAYQQHLYIPLTMLSLMSDVSLFGPGPGGFHLTNVIIHVLNVLLLFAFLERTTKSPWKSFFAAALWALHPMRVESVAWITERKDILSGFFFFLGLHAYRKYANDRKPLSYALVFLSMLAGLACKPVLVIFPIVLLILDFWPLERIPGDFRTLKTLFIEKLPLFALSIAFSALTMHAHRSAIYSVEQVSPAARLSDMATAYMHYLTETLYPVRLAMEDRFTSTHLTGLAALGAAALLATLSIVFWRSRKTVPAVTAGWLWYVVLLFPVSGVVPFALYFVADHFTYLPHTGIFILIVWGCDSILDKLRVSEKFASALLAILIAALASESSSYLYKWKDSVSLTSYYYSVTNSVFSQMLLATALSDLGQHDKAAELLDSALASEPGNHLLHFRKGFALDKMGKSAEAIESFRKAVSLKPGHGDSHYYLGIAYLSAGERDLARKHARTALNLEPGNVSFYFLVARTELESGNTQEGYALLREIAAEWGESLEILYGSGLALGQAGYHDEAADYFKKTVDLSPSNPDFNYNLAMALLESGRGDEAERYFQAAVRLDPDRPDAHFVYGRWLGSTGRTAEAESQFRELLRINPEDAGAIEELRKLGVRP